MGTNDAWRYSIGVHLLRCQLSGSKFVVRPSHVSLCSSATVLTPQSDDSKAHATPAFVFTVLPWRQTVKSMFCQGVTDLTSCNAFAVLSRCLVGRCECFNMPRPGSMLLKGKRNNGQSKPAKSKTGGGNSYINADFFIRGKASAKGSSDNSTKRIASQVHIYMYGVRAVCSSCRRIHPQLMPGYFL